MLVSLCLCVAALNGRVVDLYTRVGPENVRGPETRTVSLTAWCNERVHGQVAVWSETGAKGLRLVSGDLRSEAGGVIPAKCAVGRFVRAIPARFGTEERFVPDLLEEYVERDLAPDGFAAAWLTVGVTADVAPGTYTGSFAVVAADGARADFPVSLAVLPRTLPAYADRRFFLDIWQHPWSVARDAGVRPFSPEHLRLMEPFLRELGGAGQKAITCSITDLPWGEATLETGRAEVRTMVRYVRRRDGSYRADFTDFDAYVSCAKKCGVGPQIHCYTIAKIADLYHNFYFENEETGEHRAVEIKTGSLDYERFLTPLLQQLEAHVETKGWLDDTFIALDEVPPDVASNAVAFVRKTAPRLKIALASNKDPMLFAAFERDVDVFSQILWKDYVSPEFLRLVETRKSRGQVTTFYVCTQPQKPNTWFASPLVEAEWIGLYSAAKGFDGFLRWAGFFWDADPLDPRSARGSYQFPPGEVTLLYPKSWGSVRWEILRDSFEDWEKIRVLRASGCASAALESRLAELDFKKMETADEAAYRNSVEGILREVNGR